MSGVEEGVGGEGAGRERFVVCAVDDGVSELLRKAGGAAASITPTLHLDEVGVDGESKAIQKMIFMVCISQPL